MLNAKLSLESCLCHLHNIHFASSLVNNKNSASTCYQQLLNIFLIADVVDVLVVPNNDELREKEEGKADEEITAVCVERIHVFQFHSKTYCCC